MRIRFIILLIVQILTLNTFAQEKYCNCNSESKQSSSFEVNLIGKAFTNKYPGKSKQFYKSWLHGELQMSDGTTVKNKILGYNRLLDEIIWVRKSDYQQVVLSKKTIAGFTLYGPNIIKVAEFKKLYLKNWLTGDSTDTYLQVLVKGRLTLFVERKVVLIRNTDEFQTQDQYYLQKDGVLNKLVPNRWFLFRLMSDEKDKKRMKAIVRKNFLFVKKEPKLIKAIQLFNEVND
jgi:hypothetical protein